jgi:GNAT superfamily N-acetyltransferase
MLLKSLLNTLKSTRIINNNNIFIKYSNYNKDIAMTFYNIDTGRIESLFVDHQFRNKGIGSHMLRNIIHEMDEEYVKKIIYKPSSQYYHKFWQKNNFIMDKSGIFYYKN